MSKTIMLIDDVEINNFVAKRLIMSVKPDVNICEFTNPLLAYNAMDEVNPDLILLDLSMPVMDGWAYLDKMKEDGKGYRVVILTSSTSEMDKTKSKDYGNVIAFSIKPLDTGVLDKYGI